MKRFRLFIPITLGLCLMVQTSWAAKAYVTDSFRISLRRGPSIENKILKFLPSGQPVEIFETNEGWSHIQPLKDSEDNIKGWVLSRYLITRLPWENQARSLMQRNARIQEKLTRIEKEWGDAARREQGLTKELKVYIESLHKLRNEYETLKREATDYLNLKAAYKATQGTIEMLTNENKSLRSSQMNKWFAMGGLVLLCGLIIGLMIGRQQKRPKPYY